MSAPSARPAGWLELPAVISGAVMAFLIVVPAAVAQLLIPVPSVRWLLFGVVFVGFGVGGYRAASIATATPLTSGALAALLAFVAAQSLAVAARLASGGSVTITALAFLAMLATSCGMLGAGIRLRRGSGPPAQGSPAP
jgi:hypothetical protein